MLIGTTLFP